MKFASATVFLLGVVMVAGARIPGSKARANSQSAIGLELGSKIPAFRLRDQKDEVQSNETLKGTNGTIMLFFRSADW